MRPRQILLSENKNKSIASLIFHTHTREQGFGLISLFLSESLLTYRWAEITGPQDPICILITLNHKHGSISQMHDKGSDYISTVEKKRREHTACRPACQDSKIHYANHLGKPRAFRLLILFVCQLEQGSGEILPAVQLKVSSCCTVTICTDDALHKGGGGAEGAGSSHLFFS